MTDKQNMPVNEVAPVLLERITGQPQVISLLTTRLAAYWNDRQAGKNPSFGPVIFAGPSGTGKTLVAHGLHHSLANLHLIEVIGDNLDDLDTLYSILMQADENTTIFIDECQGLGKAAQHILLKALAEQKLCIPKGKCGKSDYQIPLSRFVAIFATTHEFCLQEALRNRMKVYCRFNYYSVDNLTGILKSKADSSNWKYQTPEIFSQIAARSKRTPRVAINHLENCYHVMRSQDTEVITIDHVRQAFELSEVDELGLDHLERSYLKLLAKSEGLKLNMISSKLGLPNHTIQMVVEPYLIQEELIDKQGSERIITEKGRQHLNGSF
jgi:holliday junction DNA helicase RuvB